MKNGFVRAGALALTMAAASTASAGGAFGGTSSSDDPLAAETRFASVMWHNYEFDQDLQNEARPKGIGARVGMFIVDYLSFELRAATDVRDAELSGTPEGTTIDVDVSRQFAGYLAGHMPITEHLSGYLMGGLADTQVEQITEVRDDEGNLDETSRSRFNRSDFAYGVGLEVHPTSRMSLTVEYNHVADSGDFELSSVNAGLGVRW